MTIPFYEFGGDGPLINLAVANGFPPQTYHPLLDPLTGHCRIVCALPRPLWPDPPPPESVTGWPDLADDLLRALDARGLADVIAVGHSMGGIFSLIAAAKEPERFRALVLLDPTALPPYLLAGIRLLRGLGQQERLPLVRGARKRRAHFPDREAAFDYWRPKPLFRGWTDEALRFYVEGMTEPDPAGGWRLAWSPDWEARVYATVVADPYRWARRLPASLPVLVVRGQQTDAFTAASERAFRRAAPGATYRTIAGHGHLFPHTAPDQARSFIESWLNTTNR